MAALRRSTACIHDSKMCMCRFGYINWLWYGWGALMINQYKNDDVKVYGDTGVLEYYSLNGLSEWAFLGYSALSFVVFFLIAYIVSHSPRSMYVALKSFTTESRWLCVSACWSHCLVHMRFLCVQ